MKTMIVDDSRSTLLQLARMTTQAGCLDHHLHDNPVAALNAASSSKFDLFIVDHIMPEMDGIRFTRSIRAMEHHSESPILMVTGTNDEQIRIEALEAGATDFLSKSGNRLEMQVKLKNLVALARALKTLDDHVQSLASEIAAATKTLLDREEEMIFRLSKAVEYRDNDTGEHTLRVARYSRMIAERLGLPPEQCRSIYLASPLHDVGKVAVPDGILLKPGRLDPDEMAKVRTHTTVGEEILGGSTCELIKLSSEIAGGHHERWDGNGYPRRLSGEDIPLSARIVAVADVFDALTTERPYKTAMSFDEAASYLRDESGKHFDPACVAAFLNELHNLKVAA
jgi:putative two-component system response regulator